MRIGSSAAWPAFAGSAAMSSRISAPDSTSCSCSRVGGMGFARAQVDRAARALYAQVFADACRHADAHVAVDEDHALLADHQRHGQG
jgi:hypothetical protein